MIRIRTVRQLRAVTPTWKSHGPGGELPDLDDPQIYRDLDPSGMVGRMSDVPRQCLQGWRQASETPFGGLERSYNHVLIAGMGGSAIAGDLVADLASLQGRLPVTVVREFGIPFTLDRRTLMFACSYSGNTEETLSMFRQGLDMGSAVIAVTSGGLLAKEAEERGVPTLRVDAQGEPRSAAVYNFTLLLGVLTRLGSLNIEDSDVEATSLGLSHRVQSLSPDIPANDNLAKQLAGDLTGYLPLICAGGLFRGVARRWKSQFNENSKTWAVSEALPELMHNAVEAFSAWPAGEYQPMALLLQPGGLEAEMKQRYAALEMLLNSKGIAYQAVPGRGGSPLAQLLDMLVLGDFTSYYLAMLRGIDPSPTPTLDSLKRGPTGD